MIRPATLSDIPRIAELGEQFHADAGWSDVFSYSVSDCAETLSEYLQMDAFICLVAQSGEEVVGMAAGFVCPLYFNRSHLSGEELFWWVSQGAPQMTGMRLLDALEAEARARGCKSWQMKSLDKLGGERMAALYARKGYRPSERSFIKRF